MTSTILNEVAKSSVVLDRELEEGKSLSPPIRASAARTAAGRIANKTNGPAPAGKSGTRSIREAFAQHASVNGLRPSAFHAVDGRRTRSGTCLREK